MTRHAALAGVLAVALLAACGVSPQRAPVAIDVPVPTEASPASPSTSGPGATTLYLVRDDHLEAVQRPSTSGTLDDAVDALSAGPSREEAGAGLRSAIAVDSVRTAETDDDDVVVVDVSHDFVETSGSDQLLAVAQLVWTVTEASGSSGVRLTSGGDPVEVPTDRGLSSGDVARDDYASVAPTAHP